MIKKYSFYPCLCTLFFTSRKKNSENNAKSKIPNHSVKGIVDPFINTGGHARTYQCAGICLGMVQLIPDNGRNGWNWSSDYYSDSIPYRTQYWLHEILKTPYNTTPNGLSGNEDAGQMSAWYVLSSMGLNPFNPVSGEYQIGSPLFEKSTISLKNGKMFSIEVKNVSSENFYIQSASFNGEVYERSYINHGQLENGGTLQLEMGNAPNKEWATGKFNKN
ncbi:glycoside hydrolase domain-containing protein [Gramella sp. AN32]|uniref:Glycoside hydrolase domain-containing protein n=1 Tax=Christiangramia antarctica TaxID=2058158 RepID=A0ABW5X3K9_9FLAO|nr:hypothetical protein [Gramella sp. AN32]